MLLLRKWVPRDMLAAAAARVPKKRLAGGWLSDLAELGKAIVLCHQCERKWNARTYGYRKSQIWPGQEFVNGECDGCRQYGQQRHMFLRSKE